MTETNSTSTDSPRPDTRSPQGRIFELTSPAERQAALDQAFDYRGDVTLHTTDGKVIEGYVFDRRIESGKPCVRVIPSQGGGRVSVRYEDITRLEFTGRDTAAGKSWETWVKKYVQKKLRGEEASLHAEGLEE